MQTGYAKFINMLGSNQTIVQLAVTVGRIIRINRKNGMFNAKEIIVSLYEQLALNNISQCDCMKPRENHRQNFDAPSLFVCRLPD